jgi:DNA polymerase I-like protein with 3'-5' exonuclease and polymerase domains
MRLIFDLETNGLLDTVSEVHCIVTHNVDTGEVRKYDPHHLQEALARIEEASELIGHNIMAYDLEVLKKLYQIEYTGKVTDTLVLSRLIWSDLSERDFNRHRKGEFPSSLIGSHSLKAWGVRLGVLKGSFNETTDWQQYTPEMLEYCAQDVVVTTKLYEKITEKDYSEEAIALEHDIHKICLQQTKHGFPFDINKAVELYAVLQDKRSGIKRKLEDTFGSWWESQGEFIPKRTQGHYTAGCPCTKIERITFNPSSREHIAKKLKELGWKPSVFTENGAPKVDEAVLSALPYPEAKLLCEYLLIEKRIGQLAEGRQSWLKLERSGKIHGQVTTMGAVTSRCTHQYPNMAQVPSVKATYGKECRSLFHAPKGYLLMGCDVSGLELRCLAHFMARYDGGAYGKILLEGDIHSANQEAAGLPTRDNAKTFIYAFLYGAGDEKIGKIIGKGSREGKKLKASFLAKTPALDKLKSAVQTAAERGFIKGLDGRLMPIRSAHAALNTLLQGAGAIICKRWVVRFHELLESNGFKDGIDYMQVAYVHDEVQVLVKEEYAESIAKLCIQAIKDAGEHYNLRIPLDGEYKFGRNWAETH